MNKNAINIAILEPSQIIFEGLSNILSKNDRYSRIFKLDDLNDIANLSNVGTLDLVIVNPSHIQNKNKEFISIKKNYPDSCWVCLIYSFYDQLLISLFDKIIHITDSTDTILTLINKSVNAETHISHSIEQEQLSDREIEVLKLVVAGLSNKEIADKLFISIHTVISHRKNISQKTGIKSQSGLTIYAISNKIIQIEDYTS